MQFLAENLEFDSFWSTTNPRYWEEDPYLIVRMKILIASESDRRLIRSDLTERQTHLKEAGPAHHL